MTSFFVNLILKFKSEFNKFF